MVELPLILQMQKWVLLVEAAMLGGHERQVMWQGAHWRLPGKATGLLSKVKMQT